MNYINVNTKRLVKVGSNNQQLASPLVIDYSTITELQFQFVNDQNQTLPIDSEKVGLYFAGSLGIGKEAFELLFLSKEYTIENNILTFTLDTYTVNYLNYIKKKNTEINIEIGENFFNQKKVYLRDMAYACPRVYVTGLTPMEIASNDYYTKEEVDALLSGGGGGISGQVQADWAVDNPALVSFIKNKPTDVSAFNNDAGYITGYTEIDPVFTATSGLFELKTEAFSGSYNDLTDKPEIPTKVSDLENDEGYITGYTEIDPVFTATSGLFELKTEAFSGSYNDLTDKPTIPSAVSELTNDEGYITGYTEIDPIYAAASGRIVFLNNSNKIPKQYYVTNKQYVKTDPIVYESDSINSFDLVYDPNYEIFINTISLTDNILNLGQIEFVNSDIEVGEAVTFEHWLKFENNTDANTILLDSNITVIDEIPQTLSGTLTHVFVRRLYRDSQNQVHESISHSFSF